MLNLNILAGVCSAISTIMLVDGAFIAADPVLGWCQVILASISIILTVVSSVLGWYINAKKDGKITAEEVKDLVDKVNKDINKKG